MSFKEFLLLLFVILCATFIYVKTQSLGDENSHFNQHTRYTLGKYKTLRTLFSLRKDGDARKEYLVGTSPIVVEVVWAEGLQIDQKVLDGFAASVREYTGRVVKLYNNDTFKRGVLTEADMKDIVSKKRRRVIAGEPNLFVMYAEGFQGGDEVGRTYQEFGMLISHSKIVNLTASYPSARNQYIESTMLHEFGHQIGLGHNDYPDCVMNESVENPKRAQLFSGTFTPTEFCQQELEQLRNIKKRLE